MTPTPSSSRPDRPLRIAIIGAGPAGVYTADILTKEERDFRVSIDLFDRYPAPFGLIRYGVAPDHPRIKEIVKALRRVLAGDQIRFIGNVDFGTDVTFEQLRENYDAVIFATGAMGDRPLDIPGIEKEGSFGAADFVSWYDGHPDVPREWPLEAESVAVIGAGNVALDVARMLAKPADEQLTTEIPDNVYQGLKANRAKDVHVFARRGPAHLKFSPMEFRELSHSPSVDVVMTEEGFELLPGSHPITPVMFPGEDGARQAAQIADAMLEHGVYVIAFSYPVVPQGQARIRVQLSAAHSEEDVRTCVRAFVAARDEVLGAAD